MFNTKHFTQYLLMLTVLFSGLLVTSCSDDGGDDGSLCEKNIANQTATGKLLGADFTFAEGEVKENFADDTEYRYTLYGESIMGDICEFLNPDKPNGSIIFSVPKSEGTYDLGLDTQLSVTFNDATGQSGANAYVVTCGTVEITTITATTISGKLIADYDTDNNVEGTFTATLCQ